MYPHYILKVLEFDQQLRQFVKVEDECILLFLKNEALLDKWVAIEVNGISLPLIQ